MTARILKGTAPAFFISDSYGPDDLTSIDGALNSCCLAPHCRRDDGSTKTPAGWTYIGEAEVTLTLVDDDALVANKVESLRAQRTKELADSHARTVEIDRKIQQLLAITNDVGVAA